MCTGVMLESDDTWLFIWSEVGSDPGREKYMAGVDLVIVNITQASTESSINDLRSVKPILCL